MIFTKNIGTEWRKITIGNIKVGRVRIYKFNTFKALTETESKIYNDRKKKNTELLEAIHKNKEIRKVDSKYLKEDFEIAVFENDITRLAFEDRGITEADYQLLDEIVYMEVFHNEIMWQILKDGIYIDDKEYMLFSATTGQVRNKTITLMKKDFFEKHKGYLMVGLSKERINTHTNNVKKDLGMNVGKYLSYNALPLSSSVLPENVIDIDRCIVVKGLETVITDNVKYVDIQTDKDGQCYVADTPKEYITKDIEIEHTDGAGMFLPGELPSSCQIRGGYFKGAMFPFDFRLFSNKVAHNSVIPDAWGDMVDVEKEDIRFVLTTSQLKMWKEYDSWEEYKKYFRENNLKLSINSYANPPKEEVTFAYQYLQTLPYGTDISQLCKPAVDDLTKLKTDIDYVKQELGLTSDVATDEDVDENIREKEAENKDTNKKKSNSYIAKALDLYPSLIYDSYVKNKIQSLFTSRKKSYMGGKLPIRGYYSYIVPDMYAFCEYLFMGEKNPQGLIPKNHVYNKYYDECGNIENVICLRSPHLSRYEYPKRKLIRSDECRKWFGAMESDTVVSCHDLISKSLQCDWDGDEVLISADKNLYHAAESLPEEPLYYEMQKAEAQIIDDEAIYDTLKNGFDNNVIGESSNAITKLWNVPELKENPLRYDDAINVFCAYSNYTIDFPKTGKSLALGEYEQLYKDLIPPEDIREKTKPPKVKYPQFFKYAKGKKNNLEEYTNSPMDRIAKYIDEQTGRKHYKYFDNDKKELPEFDYRMLMNNEIKADGVPKYEVNRSDSRYMKLYKIMYRRKRKKKAICQSIQKQKSIQNMDAKEIMAKYDVFHYHCVREIKEAFTNPQGYFDVNLAVNYMIDMEYKNKGFISTSKDILWKCFGHIIIDNINRNLESDVKLKERPRMSYIKAVKGNSELDDKISEGLQRKSVAITQSDMEFMNTVLVKKKNGGYYNNDRELLFAIMCHYKYAELNGNLQNGYLQITKKKHTIVKKNGQKKKVKIQYNMNTIMQMVGAKSYVNSFKRFIETGLVQIEEDNTIHIKINIPNVDILKEVFIVEDIYNPYVYLLAWEQDKKLSECVVCGKHFIKENNNQKTCCDECSEILHNINVGKTNKKNRITAQKDRKK
ncbi:MAG: hypothetical protein SO445_03920 [Lachnospiraceae bacterium]|nr:hypothetical protein [Lachnospiraceae bacterium]MDY4616843.1 hypothetical protein [Lachnospiraceae bacterium]